MKWKGIMLVLLGAASFGFTPIFVKTGFEFGYSLGQLNITQMVVAVILLGGMSLVKGLKFNGITKKDFITIIVTGLFVGLTSIFYYGAMEFLPASLAIILLFQFVWIGMVYEWIFSKMKPTRVNFISLVITLTGVFFASDVLSGDVLDFAPIGILLGLLAGVTYAGFIFFSGQAATTSHPILRSFIMIVGATILVLIIFYQDIPTLYLDDGRLWALGAGIALVGAVIPPLFFAGGAPLISGRLANVLSSIELPVAIVSAMLILSESVTVLQWFGILLIIMAIVVNELGDQFMYNKRSLGPANQ
ncbi:DMT family transporter [Thalassobacillus sp. CUG 92003]|uniref:EamA family transporter n=1 Tax=Thalassobacillus sp. CUG 92003 TaxID=2736641 RepID=UPI0015E77572|nr:DMT family transporter [Thalassobacillus sp. CUG 92003]